MSKNEQYQTTIRYYNCRTKQNQKYITIELPADSAFNVDERVSISIASSEQDFSSSVSTDKRITVGSIMRQMNVGDTATFDIEQWDNLRSIASRIKDMYGSTFSVRRDKHRPENIVVIRLN